MNENIFLAAFFFPAAAAVLIFFMKYVSVILQARATAHQDAAYRELAMRAAAAQSETVAALSAFSAVLADLQARLAGIEKILRDVE